MVRAGKISETLNQTWNTGSSIDKCKRGLIMQNVELSSIILRKFNTFHKQL